MSTRTTADYRDAIEPLPDGTTLVIQQFSWDDYERLLDDLSDRPHLRVSYDRGTLEIMTPLQAHEEYARFIDDLVRVFAEEFDVKLEKRGSVTWKRRSLARAVEPDACYYVRARCRSPAISGRFPAGSGLKPARLSALRADG